jgi:transposase
MAASNSPFQRRYPPEMRERAVRMVHEAIAESGERVGAVTRVAGQLGIGPESLRNWVKQAEIDSGKRPGVTSAEQQRIAELEREVRDLRRANEILKAASAFFAYMSTIGMPCGLARFFAAQVRLWLFLDAPPTRHPGPHGVT